MVVNKEELKNKILYRSSYRGSKEMDILLSSFVKSIINNLETIDLLSLNELVNLDDQNLNKIRIEKKNIIDLKDNYILKKFIEFKL
tara:strand:- start:418 stop:675 length:258 start_codon:yes stop_codon:yes gene_type:complete